jgi:hypothetical protein
MKGKAHSEEREISRQMRVLVERDVLEHPTARAIARLIAERDLSILTPDQRYIYEWHIKPHLRAGHSDEGSECII